MAAEKSYAHRDVLDKLGIAEGMRVRIVGAIPDELLPRLRERAGDGLVGDDDSEPVNVILYRVEDAGIRAAFARLRQAITPEGAIWALTAKRGQPGYIQQERLIPLGKAAGLVDNKSCSVDEVTSAIRFVIPLAQRTPRKPAAGDWY